MYLRVRNLENNEEGLALIMNEGLRIYSSNDDSGAEDITVSNEDFTNKYEIIGTVEDELDKDKEI